MVRLLSFACLIAAWLVPAAAAPARPGSRGPAPRLGAHRGLRGPAHRVARRGAVPGRRRATRGRRTLVPARGARALRAVAVASRGHALRADGARGLHARRPARHDAAPRRAARARAARALLGVPRDLRRRARGDSSPSSTRCATSPRRAASWSSTPRTRACSAGSSRTTRRALRRTRVVGPLEDYFGVARARLPPDPLAAPAHRRLRGGGRTPAGDRGLLRHPRPLAGEPRAPALLGARMRSRPCCGTSSPTSSSATCPRPAAARSPPTRRSSSRCAHGCSRRATRAGRSAPTSTWCARWACGSSPAWRATHAAERALDLQLRLGFAYLPRLLAALERYERERAALPHARRLLPRAGGRLPQPGPVADREAVAARRAAHDTKATPAGVAFVRVPVSRPVSGTATSARPRSTAGPARCSRRRSRW